MHTSVTKLETLSLEIFLEIFDYLSINDCFKSFYNLKWYINSAIKLSYFSINLTSISHETYENFYEKIIFSNHIQQIRKIKISNDLTIGLLDQFFNDYYIRDFKQLRSLVLIKPSYMTLSSLAIILPKLQQLEHISIDSNSYPMNFFESITTKSNSLKFCYLPGLEIQDPFNFQSNIESLTITIEDITILLNLLAAFPQLKSLYVILRSTMCIDNESLPEINHIYCQNLEVLKICILERSMIQFKEIEYFFQHTKFQNLKSFSYYCTTTSLNHLNSIHWQNIFEIYLSSIIKLIFFIQIPCNSNSLKDIKEILNNLQTKSSYSFFLSINSLYYMIHTHIYPPNHFNISLKSSQSDEELNSNPLNCNIKNKFSKVNSLFIDNQSLNEYEILPENIKCLYIQNEKASVNFDQFLRNCSKQLVSLKITGLPSDLPQLFNLRKLTIQRAMFNLNMAKKLTYLCPNLQLLTIEIDCIKQFGEILDQLRFKSNLTELKFIQAFSRDPNQTWLSWLNETKEYVTNINYDIKDLFLFIWL